MCGFDLYASKNALSSLADSKHCSFMHSIHAEYFPEQVIHGECPLATFSFKQFLYSCRILLFLPCLGTIVAKSYEMLRRCGKATRLTA
jgi:hypothetical protein